MKRSTRYYAVSIALLSVLAVQSWAQTVFCCTEPSVPSISVCADRCLSERRDDENARSTNSDHRSFCLDLPISWDSISNNGWARDDFSPKIFLFTSSQRPFLPETASDLKNTPFLDYYQPEHPDSFRALQTTVLLI